MSLKHHPYKYRFAMITLLVILIVFILSFTWGFALGRQVERVTNIRMDFSSKK